MYESPPCLKAKNGNKGSLIRENGICAADQVRQSIKNF